MRPYRVTFLYKMAAGYKLALSKVAYSGMLFIIRLACTDFDADQLKNQLPLMEATFDENHVSNVNLGL